MAQLIQAGFSLGAILLLSALVWWLYPRGGRLNEIRIEADFARVFPEEKFGDSLLSSDFSTALVRSLAGKLYIARAMGRDITLRLITIKHAALNATTLSLDLDDFTMPSCDLTFDAETCAKAKNWLSDAGISISR